jgi:tetratricopeptide (TPR) repeat protein
LAGFFTGRDQLLAAWPRNSVSVLAIPGGRGHISIGSLIQGMTVTDAMASVLADALRDRYVLGRELGRGGMATVYLARDLKHDRVVALKVLHPELAASLGPERFLREIHLTAQLDHLHILPVFDSGNAAGILWYTMPYVQGESLRDRLRRELQLPIEEAVRITREVAEALDYAHRHNVVHRDIKPENVMVGEGHARVADFGVARALESAGSRLTETGLSVGTPAYMSPEQATAGAVDGRSDIYALGCVLYEMLAGEPPFTAATPQAVIAKRLSTPPVPLGVVRHAVPPAIDAAVMRALAREPVDRFATGAEFAAALESPAPATVRARSVSRGAMVAAGVVALALAAGLALALRRQPQPINAKVVAVAPFRISSADPSLTYLREGLVDLLAAKLGGAAGVRASDPRSVLAAWRSAAGSTVAELGQPEALRVAAGLGAAQLVLGDLVGTPSRVVVHATLLTVPSGTQIADATVEGPADSLPALVDRLAAKVLLIRAGEDQQRVASLTTPSFSALRAYLEGQSLYRRGRFADASRQYEEAIRLDSTFALAGLMLLQATGWQGSREARELGFRVASRSRDQLGERDRALLDASSTTRSVPMRHSTAEFIRAAERYVEVAPDSPDAWALLADWLYHFGPMLGLEDAHRRSLAAFKRALEFDSTFAPALAHLPPLYGEAGDTAALRASIGQFLATDSTADNADALRWYGAMMLVDSATVRAMRTRFDRFKRSSLVELMVLALDAGRGLPDVARAIATLRAGAVSEAERTYVIGWQLRFAWDGGRPIEARQLTEQLQGPEVPLSIVQAAIAWDGDSAAGAAAARTLERHVGGHPPSGVEARDRHVREVFTLAEYHLAHGDASMARRAVRLLEELPVPPDSAWLGRNARVAALLLDAQLGALDRRPQAPAQLARADSALRTNVEPVQFVALGNLIVARLWEASGDPARALAAVRRRIFDYTQHPFLTTMLRQEGRLAELTGDRPGAIEAYQRYLALRPDPEPALQPQVEQVRAELARLAGAEDPR